MFAEAVTASWELIFHARLTCHRLISGAQRRLNLICTACIV